MTTENPTLADARAVTPKQLTTMTPREIDALNAVVGAEYARIDGDLAKAWNRLYGALLVRQERVRSGRGYRQVWPIDRQEAEERAQQHLTEGYEPEQMTRVQAGLYMPGAYAEGLREALDRIEALRNETFALNQGPNKVLNGEWDRRGGWSRFFLVTSSDDGHIHKTNERFGCGSFRDTTTFGWHPELSGLTEKDAVDVLGPFLCTNCFPSAPTEWTQNPEDVAREAKKKNECKGSREYIELDSSMARRVYRFAKCPECGENVNVTSTSKFRAHPPKKTT